MAKRAMAAWKVVGMVLLVVLPGGSIALLALATYRAWKRQAGPFAPGARAELRRAFVAPFVVAARFARMPFQPAQTRA